MPTISLLVLLMAADPAGPAGNGPLMDNCFVSLSDDVEISAQEAGPLVEPVDEQGRALRTRDGQNVQRGMLLAQIDDSQPRLQRQAAEAELKAARAKAEDDIEIRYSDAAYRVAQAEYQSSVEANRKIGNTIPQMEIRRLELTQQRARLQIDRSKLEQNVARLEADVSQANVDAAQAAMQRRRIASPIDGVLLAVHKQPGEWVQAGEPVLRVARMDLLRVEGLPAGAKWNWPER
jgi:macrolide-specific efflux system membrane fusion protein